MDWPVDVLDPPSVSSMGPESALWDCQVLTNQGLGSGAWWSASAGIFVPIVMQRPFVVVQLWVVNGGAVSGNFDIGVYDYGLAKKVSQSAAQAGTNVKQLVNCTDTSLPPGRYYLGLAFDNTTAQVQRFTLNSFGPYRLFCLFKQAAAYTLPATATPAALSGGETAPLFGMQLGRMT